ncbi:type II methionyl aminopeptidase [Candidatus Margulisiibacteriota bacterium]
MKNNDYKELLNIEEKVKEIKTQDPELCDLIKNIEDWLLAGRITAFLLAYGKGLVTKGTKLRTVAEKIENKANEINHHSPVPVKLAFPVNMSLNECAAHYSPGIMDETVFTDQIVKLDIGISIKGAIGDAAVTIDLSGKNNKLVIAVEKARDKAISMVKPGLTVTEIGKEVENIITSYNFRPIRNLGGHQIERYNLHAGIFVPNYNSHDQSKLQKGQILAIEPFASTGKGSVENSNDPEIFVVSKNAQVKDRTTRKILNAIDYYDGLPFSKLNLYNLSNKNSLEKINQALLNLDNLGMLYGYCPLSDVKGCLTSQSEHTVIVGDKPIITTII